MKDVLENLQKLPPHCLAIIEGQVVFIRRGAEYTNYSWPKDQVDQWNAGYGISPQQVQAMIIGATMGWDMDGADPDTHAEALGEREGPFSYHYVGVLDVDINVMAHTEEQAHRMALERMDQFYRSISCEGEGITSFGFDHKLDLIESDDPHS